MIPLAVAFVAGAFVVGTRAGRKLGKLGAILAVVALAAFGAYALVR